MGFLAGPILPLNSEGALGSEVRLRAFQSCTLRMAAFFSALAVCRGDMR